MDNRLVTDLSLEEREEILDLDDPDFIIYVSLQHASKTMTVDDYNTLKEELHALRRST